MATVLFENHGDNPDCFCLLMSKGVSNNYLKVTHSVGTLTVKLAASKIAQYLLASSGDSRGCLRLPVGNCGNNAGLKAGSSAGIRQGAPCRNGRNVALKPLETT